MKWIFRLLGFCVLLSTVAFVNSGIHPLAAPPVPDGNLHPNNQPDKAMEYYTLKRAPAGQVVVPVERYIEAAEHAQRMPLYSTALSSFIPSRSEALDSESPNLVLGSWTPLGPGNIGGRTRRLLIHPSAPTTMYAAGVAGGVWKTTNGGSSWVPLSDLMLNIAVCSMAMDPTNPNTIYAGTGEGYFNTSGVRGAGIFKTTDGGASWAYLASTNTPDFHYVNDIVISPTNSQRLYAGTRTGVWRSTDGGASWSLSFNQIGATPNEVLGGCLDLAIRTDRPTDWVLASFGTINVATVFRNTDAGGSGSWVQSLTEGTMARTTLAIAPSNQAIVYALSDSTGGVFAGGMNAVFRSTDFGVSWLPQVRSNSPVKLNTVLLSDPINAFLVECGFGSTNQFLDYGWFSNVIAVDPVDPNRVWVGGVDLFRSDDAGMNWGVASYYWTSPHYVHALQHAIVFHPQYNGTTNQSMFVANDGGIFKTDNARAATANGPPCSPVAEVNWTALNNNYGVTQFNHGLPYPNGTSYLGGTASNGTVRGSDAAGINGWETLLGGTGGYVAIDPNNTNTIYAEFATRNIRKSTDGGATFVNATNGITGNPAGFKSVTPIVMDPTNSQRLWTAGQELWRTTDGATNWVQASETNITRSISTIAVAPTNPNAVLAGTDDGRIYRTNIGTTSNSTTVWPVSEPQFGFVSWVTYDPTNANIAYATYSSFDGEPTEHHVYKSTDGGATWAPIDGSGANSIPDVPVHTIVVDPTNTSRLYIGTDIGVFVTVDGGANWARENTGFANVITEALALNTVGGNTSLFAFTHGRGVWRVTVHQAAPPTLMGFLDAAGCGIITGWAWDANQPNTPINVDIYDGASLIATIPANLFREDIRNAGIGDGFHGFSFTTPASLKNGALHSIHVAFASTSTELINSPRNITCAGIAPAYNGFHDGAGCNTISGWAWDQNDPNNPINVDIYDNVTLIATVPAIQFRQDLVSAGIGNGFHGFSFTVPASLKDGATHSIRVRFPGTATSLGNTPRNITCSGAAPIYEGVFEVADCNTITGWAWDQNDPNSPINVAIFDGNQLIATVLAIQFRQSLVTQGIGNGFHVFIYNTPASLKNGLPHTVRVKFSGSTTELTSSPRSLTCP